MRALAGWVRADCLVELGQRRLHILGLERRRTCFAQGRRGRGRRRRRLILGRTVRRTVCLHLHLLGLLHQPHALQVLRHRLEQLLSALRLRLPHPVPSPPLEPAGTHAEALLEAIDNRDGRAVPALALRMPLARLVRRHLAPHRLERAVVPAKQPRLARQRVANGLQLELCRQRLQLPIRVLGTLGIGRGEPHSGARERAERRKGRDRRGSLPTLALWPMTGLGWREAVSAKKDGAASYADQERAVLVPPQDAFDEVAVRL